MTTCSKCGGKLFEVGVDAEHQASLFAKRECLGEDIEDFVSGVAIEYTKQVRWEWTSNEPDDFEAVVLLELPDGSERKVPLREVVHEGHGQGEMVIDIGDCGNLSLDAGGLYAFLWNHDAEELRNVKAQLEEWRADGTHPQLLGRMAMLIAGKFKAEVGRLEKALAVVRNVAQICGADGDKFWCSKGGRKLYELVARALDGLPAQPAPDKPASLPELTAEEKRACEAFDIKRVTGKPASPAGGGK